MDILIEAFGLFKIFLFAVAASFTIVGVYYAIGYPILERFVDPSFNIMGRRLIDLCISLFIISILIVYCLDLIASHFHISQTIIFSPFKIIIPSLIYLIIRCIVRFHSSRIARDHINMLVFIALVSLVVNYAYFLNSKPAFVFSSFTSIFFIKLGILSILIPLTCESILFALPSLNWIRKYVIKDSRLIDLTEELPVGLEFLSGQTNINNRIYALINDNHKDELRILTNSYTTVEKHKDSILARCGNGGVKIIGSKPDPDSAIEAMCRNLKNDGMLICQGKWDGIRVVIDGDRRLLASFATGGYQGSHIGIFSSHPFIISLFKTYFDTKCSGLKCKDKPCMLHKCKTNNNKRASCKNNTDRQSSTT